LVFGVEQGLDVFVLCSVALGVVTDLAKSFTKLLAFAAGGEPLDLADY
jgi:hypothetical protein